MANRVINLSEAERASLTVLIGKDSQFTTLKNHYENMKKHYDEWANELARERREVKGKTLRISESGIQKLLVTRIQEFDGELFRIVSHPAVKDKLHLSYDQICKILARNSMARNPVRQ